MSSLSVSAMCVRLVFAFLCLWRASGNAVVSQCKSVVIDRRVDIETRLVYSRIISQCAGFFQFLRNTL